MSDTSLTGAFPIEHSSLFSRHLAEQEQIARVKWLESEKVGYDVGYARAKWVWLTTERANWIAGMRASGADGF